MTTESNCRGRSQAVLLTCHGTVERPEDVAAFVQNIRRGRPASEEIIAEVRRRFEAVGGSPLVRVTHAQARALEDRLAVPVRAAARLWHPYPKEVLAKLAADGVSRVVSLPLAPHSVHIYHPQVQQAAAECGIEVRPAPSWGQEPSLVGAFVEAIAETLARFAPRERGEVAVVLSAHSLPLRALAAGDPYERDFRATARAVTEGLDAHGLASDQVVVAFQSQGLDGGAWLGPDLATTLRELAQAGRRAVIMAPIGFVAEHVETLWDIDVEAAALAREQGFVRFERMPAMNTREAFMGALEAVARPLLG